MSWPRMIDLNLHERHRVAVDGRQHELELLRIDHHWQPDHWNPANHDRRTLAEAVVQVRVDDQTAELRLRPFEWPKIVGPLRLLVNATDAWAHQCEIHAIEDMRHHVRLEWLAADEPWGPAELAFPIRNYRWRANSYNNTWSALVPYNQLYYHRGEDYGAIPDRLEVVAMGDGMLFQMPDEPVLSNTVRMRTDDGYCFSYGHMNIGFLNRSLSVNQPIRAGTVLGRTGSTWQGRECQHSDPHLHMDISRPTGQRLASFPILAQAYLRTYPDAGLAVAGGYTYALPGDTVTLDATRSLARPGREIVRYQWRLHDGQVRDEPCAAMTPDQCGHFAEELTIFYDDGSVARDFLQVRVFSPANTSDPTPLTAGWCYHHPVRDIRPGMPVIFWNRLRRAAEPVRIDFGDGSPDRPIVDDVTYAYQRPGLYSVTLHTRGTHGEPVTVAMPVHVQ